MNLRQAIAFAIVMGADVTHFDPIYILEKAGACNVLAVPEVILDDDNRAKFKEWADRWGMDWDRERDLKRPMAEVLAELE